MTIRVREFSLSVRVRALLTALCVLWTLVVALPVALASSSRTVEETPAVAKVSCCCAKCTHGEKVVTKTCCCTAPASGSPYSIRALCDEGAPDAVLSSVSWAPPALLPAAQITVTPPVTLTVSLTFVTLSASVFTATLSLADAPPRLSA